MGVLVVVAGILLGGLALWTINERVPHEHFILEREGPRSEGLRRIWLFVLAITLHNVPEGLAVGVGFGTGDFGPATALAIGIGLQNLPEGLAVAVALVTLGYAKGQAVAVATATGLVEPVGGLIGVVDELIEVASRQRTALMCRERDPLDCHRTNLICRYVRPLVGAIHHILPDGTIEDHGTTERRLLERAGADPLPLFEAVPVAENDALERAYDRAWPYGA